MKLIKYLNINQRIIKFIIKIIYKIEDIQNDIKNIELKINKVKNEKDNIQRWILFQIQVKEKLITIPNYYNIIFEDKKLYK